MQSLSVTNAVLFQVLGLRPAGFRSLVSYLIHSSCHSPDIGGLEALTEQLFSGAGGNASPLSLLGSCSSQREVRRRRGKERSLQDTVHKGLSVLLLLILATSVTVFPVWQAYRCQLSYFV